MLPDAEVVRIIAEVFESLGLGITIKLNHRKILDGLFAVCGVASEQIRQISSSVDKLDKMAWADVKKEMVEEKNLAEDVADRIGEYVKHSGSISEVLSFIKSDSSLMANEDIKAGAADLDLLETYLTALSVIDKVSFDLSLARGLDVCRSSIQQGSNTDTG
jgi:histidyl-tRNA synthetase